MQNSQKTDNLRFDKYYPQHPLPKEIKDLPEKETVCKFCGISYLIHSEIKRLETEIIALNKKIKYFEEIEIAERTYETKCNILSTKLDVTTSNYSSLEEKFNLLKNERDSIQASFNEKSDDLIQVQSSLNILISEKEKFLSSQKNLYQQLFQLKRNNRLIKDDLTSSKVELMMMLSNIQMQNNFDIVNIGNNMDKMKKFYQSTMTDLQNEINNKNFQISTLAKNYDNQCDQSHRDAEQLKELRDKNIILLQENNILKHRLNDNNEIIAKKEEKAKLINKEMEEIKSSKTKDYALLQSQIASIQEESIKNDLLLKREKENVFALQLELKETSVKLGNVSLQNENYRKTTMTLRDDLKHLRQILNSTNQHQKEMAYEIAAMITNFKRKLSDILRWVNTNKNSTAKINEMEIALRDQKLCFEEQISSLKKEIEEEKHKKEKDAEILQNSLSQFLLENEELQNNLDRLEDNYKTGVDQQAKELETKDQIINDLENEIIVKEKIIDKMEQDLIKNNNDIHSLKLMVQQECVERLELTESLNRAREQLLLIGEINSTKSPTSLPPIQYKNSGSSISSHKSNLTHSTQKLSINERRHSTNSKNSIQSIISTKRKLERLFIE